MVQVTLRKIFCKVNQKFFFIFFIESIDKLKDSACSIFRIHLFLLFIYKKYLNFSRKYLYGTNQKNTEKLLKFKKCLQFYDRHLFLIMCMSSTID